MKIQKYLPKSYEIPLTLDVFVIGKIVKSDASKVLAITKLCPELKLGDLPHLKRIRKRQGDGEYVDILLARGDNTLNNEKIDAIFQQMVKQVWKEDLPVNAPCRKAQFEEWSKLWPINFVEPEIYKELSHSKHQIQFLIRENNFQSSQFILFDGNLQILLRFSCFKGCQEGTIQHPIMKFLEEWPKSQGFKNTPNAYYLTKLRLISKIPICGMCAMALVHSRLERIYFDQNLDIKDSGDILCCKGLNHKVNILRMFATAPKIGI